MKRALVTGGAGFIGSHLVEALIKDGYEVAVIDDLSTGSLDNLPPKGIRLFKGSVSDAGLVREAFSSHKPDYVFHLAAQISVSRSVREPAFDADINVVGSIRIMEACVREAVKKIIYTSSGGVMYGENPPVLPTPETSPCAPFSPYGIAKLTGEKYLAFFEKEHGLRWTSLRYANVYGPRQNPHGEAGVVAIFLQKMLRGQPVTINGDGEYIRDYVYVQDIVRANLLAIDRADGLALNIGTGSGLSVNRLFGLLRDQTHYRQEAFHGPARPGDLRKSVLDSSLAKTTLGWSPLMGLTEGISETVRYFEKTT